MPGEILFIGLQWGLAQATVQTFASDGRLARTVTWDAPLDLSRPDAGLDDLERRLSPLADASAPLIIAGMGAGVFEPSGGWPRIPCPVGPGQVVARLHHANLGRRRVLVSPGLTCQSAFGAPDILRGEEIAALGLAANDKPASLLSVPGRHGKWLQLRDGGIERFHTAMTVELHALLAGHSIVGRGWADVGRPSAHFLKGLETGLTRASLARTAFELRARVLAGELEPREAGDRAWGLLIGADLADLPAAILDDDIVIAGRPEVAELYRLALETLGRTVGIADADQLSAAGFRALALSVGLIATAAPAELVT